MLDAFSKVILEGWKDKDGTKGCRAVRHHSNMQILQLLQDYFNRNPTMRFHQGMQNFFGQEDRFYEEPVDTLASLKEKDGIEPLIPYPWTIYIATIINYPLGQSPKILREKFFKDKQLAWNYVDEEFTDMVDTVRQRGDNVTVIYEKGVNGEIEADLYNTHAFVKTVYTKD